MKSSDPSQRQRVRNMVPEYTARVEGELESVDMKHDSMDLFQWADEMKAQHKPYAQDAMDVNFGARKEVGKDGLSHAPIDGERYVHAKKEMAALASKKAKKKTGGEVHPEAWVFDGEPIQ